MSQPTLETVFKDLQDHAVVLASTELAKWTIPSVMIPLSTVKDGKRVILERDYQSKGAVLVNSLASKMVQSLIPDHTPFFNIVPTDEVAGLVRTALSLDDSQFNSQMIQYATKASELAITGSSYSSYTILAQLLIITGNALLYRDPVTKDTSVYSVRQFSVNRDGAGNVRRVVLHERIQAQDIPDELRNTHFSHKKPYDCEDLYTSIEFKKGEREYWEITQEIGTHPVGEPSTYPKNLCPYIVCTTRLNTGEHYGRGIVEDYAPEFARLSELSTALQDYEIESMRLLNLVPSRAGIDITELNTAQTGDYIQAEVDAIVAHEGGTSQKIQVIQAEIQSIFQELSRAFMYSGNFRNAERVTAEEIRATIQETNIGHLAVFSHVSETFLKPLAFLLLHEIEPVLTTVLGAGGGSVSLQVGAKVVNKSVITDRLLQASLVVQQVLPVLTQVTDRFNPDAVIEGIFQGFNLDITQYVYTPEQLQQIQQRQDALAQEQAQQLQGQQDPALVAQMTGSI